VSDATLQRRVLAATVVSYVVVILDTSIVNIALERIADAFTTEIAVTDVNSHRPFQTVACCVMDGRGGGRSGGILSGITTPRSTCLTACNAAVVV